MTAPSCAGLLTLGRPCGCVGAAALCLHRPRFSCWLDAGRRRRLAMKAAETGQNTAAAAGVRGGASWFGSGSLSVAASAAALGGLLVLDAGSSTSSRASGHTQGSSLSSRDVVIACVTGADTDSLLAEFCGGERSEYLGSLSFKEGFEGAWGTGQHENRIGLQSWDAGRSLASFMAWWAQRQAEGRDPPLCLQGRPTLQQQRVLELGSGTGMVGMVLGQAGAQVGGSMQIPHHIPACLSLGFLWHAPHVDDLGQ